MSSLSLDKVDFFRGQMPVCRDWSYFDHAAVAPLSLPARDALHKWLEQATGSGDIHWLEWSKRSEELRHLAARLVNARPEEIALVPNTTTGIGLIAEGFPWKPGDNLICAANEFPSNQYPWLNLASREIEVRSIQPTRGRITVDDIRPLCNDRTRLLALSWVGFSSGWRIDVNAIGQFCRERGIFFFLDAIQGLGVFPLDLATSAVDAFAADGHKWMLGPEGAGLFFIRHEWLDRLHPLLVGWNSVAVREFNTVRWQPRPTAARYEGGSLNLGGLAGLAASLELLIEMGVGSDQSLVGQRIVHLADYAVEKLQAAGATLLFDRHPGNESGIVTFQWQEEPADHVRRRLLDAQIVTSARAGGIRLSPHAYNTTDELDRLLEVLQKPSS